MNLIKAHHQSISYTRRFVILVLFLSTAVSAQAMTVFTSTVLILNNEQDGGAFSRDDVTGLLTITYNEDLLDSNGNGDFDDSLSSLDFNIDLELFGQHFGLGDDIDELPYLEVANFVPSYISLVISEVDVPDSLILDGGSSFDNYVDIDEPGVLTISSYRYGSFLHNSSQSAHNLSLYGLSPDGYNMMVELVTIPVPASAWLFVTALTGLAGVSSRRRKCTV